MPIARLIFDSFRNLLLADGMRSLISGTRQLAYQHQGTSIDLLIEPAQESKRISLVGQILDCQGKRNNEDLSVLLVSGAGTLARTATDEFGKFQMEIDSLRGANLEIRLGEQAWVMVPLAGIDAVGKPAVESP